MRLQPIVVDLVDRFATQLLAVLRQATLEEHIELRDAQRQARRAASVPAAVRHTARPPSPSASAKEITNPAALLDAITRSADAKKTTPRRPKRKRAPDSASTQPTLLAPLSVEPPPFVAHLREGETLLRSGRAGVVLRRRRPAEPSEPVASDPPVPSSEATRSR